MNKIYTKGGDKGMTSLGGGVRVKKYDIRVESYGTVDELTSFIALLSCKMGECEALLPDAKRLITINSILMGIEAHLASSEKRTYPLPPITDESIEELEKEIDRMLSTLPSINQFTIPGGSEINSLCHICRTICRRAERRVAEVNDNFTIEPNVQRYINRLSDYLYMMSRYATHVSGNKELLW